MVNNVGANVVLDLVEDSVVPVEGGQAAPQVAPLLHDIEPENYKPTARALPLMPSPQYHGNQRTSPLYHGIFSAALSLPW